MESSTRAGGPMPGPVGACGPRAARASSMFRAESPVLKLGPGGDFVVAYRAAQDRGHGMAVLVAQEGSDGVVGGAAGEGWDGQEWPSPGWERLALRAGVLALAGAALGHHAGIVQRSRQVIAGFSRLVGG